MLTEKSPHLYIIAGPNGSGKTTFAREFLPQYVGCLEFVNADFISAGLSPFAPERAAVRGGKIMLEQIHSFIDRNYDFGFESTLAGKTYVKLFRELKSKGYCIHVFFLWVSSVELALERIAKRVAMGGHNVPEAVVRRQFERGLSNFFQLYRPLADSWIIFDNSTDTPEAIARLVSGKVQIMNKNKFQQISKGGLL